MEDRPRSREGRSGFFPARVTPTAGERAAAVVDALLCRVENRFVNSIQIHPKAATLHWAK
jgi:hypothetical protein